jgi:hypothetical protein
MADCRIPILDRRGNVVAHVLVNEADADVVLRQTWRLFRGGSGTTLYAQRGNGRTGTHSLLHRDILGVPPFAGANVDHINGNGLDNRRENLRWVTHAQNMQNRKVHRHSATGVRGVDYVTADKCWRGRVRHNGRELWKRYFPTKEEAAAATQEARLRLLPYATA